MPIMFTTRDVLRLSDRWFDTRHPDAISRQSRLQSCVVLVTIFHLVMSIAFAKIDEYERRKAPKRTVSSEYAFEFMIAPPELKHVSPVPKPVTLITGDDQNTGGLTGAKQGAEKSAAPILKTDSIAEKVEKITLDAPINKRTILQPTDIPSLALRPTKVDQLPANAAAGDTINTELDAQNRGIDNGADGAFEDGEGTTQGHEGEQSGDGEDRLPPSSALPDRAASSTSEPLRVNIAPYRKDLLIRLSKQWDAPKNKRARIVLLINIANDGNLISAGVIESSGNKKFDRAALDAVHRTIFAPFSEGLAAVKQSCLFKIELRNYTD